MGFRKSDTRMETVPMLLISDLTGAGEKNVKNAVKGGVDAAIVNSEKVNVTECSKLVKTLGDIPMGILFEGENVARIADYTDCGCDFILFTSNTPLEAIAATKFGTILILNKSMPQNIARAINDLTPSIDGVLIPDDAAAVTIEYLLMCKSYSELLDKPVIAMVNSPIGETELSNIYQSGSKGLIIPGGLPEAKIASFKKVISELPKTIKQKSKRSALLPQLGSVQDNENDDDIDDD
jgi:hypothetical protein